MHSIEALFQILFGIFIIIMTAITVIRKLNFGIRHPSEIQESISLLHSRLGDPKEDYHPDQQLYEKYLADITNSDILTAMAHDILDHCQKQPWDIAVSTVDSLGSHTAGQYVRKGEKGEIKIRTGNNAYDNIILSVLIHECMHHFLRTMNLGFEDTHKNEVLTDTAALYLGFSKYMNRGYIGVGYLSYRELLFAEKMIRSGRST